MVLTPEMRHLTRMSEKTPSEGLGIWSALLLLLASTAVVAAESGDGRASEQPALEVMTPAKDEWWSLHFTSTVIFQYHPDFSAPYSGQNSMQPYAELATAFVSSVGLDVRLWRGAELVFNPEVSGGVGLSRTLGVAAFPSGIVYRVGDSAPAIYLARLFLRQTIGLGGGQVAVEGGMNQLAGTRDVNRLTFTIGRLSLTDTFDGNAYAHDPTTQFLDWALFASGAWDYPADTRGYTVGALVELTMDWWSVRGGIALEPQYANLEPLEWNITKARGLVLEYEARWTALGGRGSARVTPFLNDARMGSYGQVLADPVAYGGQVQPTRAFGRTKYGVALSIDQQLTATWGAFLRASINDGKNESWAFTEIDRSLAFGVVHDGSLWGWREYEVGLALVMDGLSGLHRDYLAQGGYGFIIGDGQLDYALEILGDFYFRVAVTDWLQLSVLYQPVFNPGYNAARGPINVFSGRVRVAF